MNKLKRLLIILLGFVTIGLASCGGDEPKNQYSLSQNELTIRVDEIVKLEVSEDGIVLADGISWSSDDEGIASVRNGNVKGVKPGSTKVNASINETRLVCEVTVVDNGKPSLSSASIKLEVGNSKTITLKQNGKDIQSGITWKSNDSEIVSVENGRITALAKGEASVTAIYENKSYICTVEVINKFNPVGSFYAFRVVPEMDNIKFEFDLRLSLDKSYEYSRRDAGEGEDFIPAEVVNSGTWEYENGVLTLTYTGGRITFLVVDDDEIKSVGEIVTGGVDSELTFNRVK